MDFFLGFLSEYQWFVILGFIGFITYYVIKYKRVYGYWKSRNIETPKPIPIFGNLYSIFLKARPYVELEWYKKFGRIYGVYQMESPGLTVSEPELIKQILVKDFHLFLNRRDNGSRHPIISKNMISARNDDWKRIRAIASPTFTSGKLKKMYALINKCCSDFIEDLEERVRKEKQFDVKQVMGNYTMDVIARCAFATNANTYKDPNSEFTTRADNILQTSFWKIFILMFVPSFIPLYISSKIRTLILGRENSMFFVNFAAKVMKHRRENNEKHNDFLQLLMDAERSDEETREEADTNEAHHVNEGEEELLADKKAFSNVLEKKLTENEILGQCFLFFIAGFETTASTLSYCTYELALHPEIQQRLYEETKEAFDEKGEIKYDVLSKLPFLDSVISETLRNYSSVFSLEREAMEDVVLGDTGIKIEKGLVVEIPIYAIHHDPEFFPDPFQFKPDRFMPENRNQIKPYTYLPFGAGPRNCIGMRFALLESKLVLAQIIQKFKFSRIATTEVPITFSKSRFLLQSKEIIVGIDKR